MHDQKHKISPKYVKQQSVTCNRCFSHSAKP